MDNTHCWTHRVEHLSGVSGWHAEARPWLDDGRCREAHDHGADVPLQHLPAKRSEIHSNLRRVENISD